MSIYVIHWAFYATTNAPPLLQNPAPLLCTESTTLKKLAHRLIKWQKFGAPPGGMDRESLKESRPLIS